MKNFRTSSARAAALSIRDEHGRIRSRWFWLAGLGVWAIWISGLFGNQGVLQAYRLNESRHDLTMRLKALDGEKTRLTASVDALKHDRGAKERAIREQLGFVRENELVFEFR